MAGARPNYMKIKPVMDALERRGAEVILVHTGQHYDESMNDVFFRDLGIRPPDRYLGAGSGSHAQQTGRVMAAFEPLIDELAPDAVVVVGDINSTLACALVTAKAGPCWPTWRPGCAAVTGACPKRSTGSPPTGSATTCWRPRPTPP